MLTLFLPPDPAVPAGFIPTTEAEIRRLDALKRIPTTWIVSVVNGKLKVDDADSVMARAAHEQRAPRKASANQLIITTGLKPGYPWRADQPGNLKVPEGWLTPVDFGEFGGGICLVDNDAKAYKFITHQNTKLIAKTAEGIFAFQSLHHLSYRFADLVAVIKDDKGWHTQPVASLEEDPEVFWQDHDHFAFATAQSIGIVGTDGSQAKVAAFTGKHYFISAALLADGDTWLGASNGLLRIHPEGSDSYAVQWFVHFEGKSKSKIKGTAHADHWVNPHPS